MKRGLFLALLLVLFTALSVPAVSAMPSDAESATVQTKSTLESVFGMKDALPFALGFGATGDFVLDRNLDNATDLEALWYGGNIYIDPILDSSFGYLKDRLHFSVFVGVADLQLGNVGVSGSTTTKVQLESDAAIAVGGGGKFDILEFQIPYLKDVLLVSELPNAQLYVSGGYRWSNPSVDSAPNLGTRVATVDMEFEVNEWHAGVGLQQRINNWIPGVGLVPYIGVQYSDIEVELTGTGTYAVEAGGDAAQTITTGSGNSDDVVAAVAGIQVWGFEDRLVVSVEGRFIAETAVSVNGRIRW